MASPVLATTRRTLADGREILYFDRVAPGASPRPRNAVDHRDLPATTTRSELRFDPLLREHVVIASHRQTRTFLPPADQCPLCPSSEGRATEIPEPDYEVAVFENRFPSLGGRVSSGGQEAPGGQNGRCEVVCFTSDHDSSFAQLGADRARQVVEVWAQRTAELADLEHVAQVYCFENHGEEIGVTLAHPHGQIYAYPFVTPRAQKIAVNAAEHQAAHGENLFGAVLADERAAGERIVAANEEWTAFVPRFARWPYEVALYPHRQVTDIPDLDDAARDGFVALYLDVLARFARRFDTPMPYVAAWNQAPKSAREHWWLNLQLFSIRRAPGKLKYLAGSESGMGAFISDTTPETVAAELRELG